MSAGTEQMAAPPRTGRAFAAGLRTPLARAMLAECRFCAHQCGVDRRAGPNGRCRAGPEPRVFLAQTEVTDEIELIPTFAIAFSGCDLRCLFCITGAESWNAGAGLPFDARKMAARAVAALRRGATSVMLLGGEPTIHLPAALEFVASMPDTARLVWKTNGHASAPARALLEGMFDTWVVDFKFGNDPCALSLAGTPRYLSAVEENLRWAATHAELIVRHLLMPGHLECCWKPAARWLAAELPGVKVNLRDGFWPAWQSSRRPELRAGVSADESRRALELARDLGLILVP